MQFHKINGKIELCDIVKEIDEIKGQTIYFCKTHHVRVRKIFENIE